MSSRPRLASIAVLGCVTTLAMLALAATACDQLNRPIGSPSSSSSSSSSSGGGSSTGADASVGEGGALGPTITAQPGDIQL